MHITEPNPQNVTRIESFYDGVDLTDFNTVEIDEPLHFEPDHRQTPIRQLMTALQQRSDLEPLRSQASVTTEVAIIADGRSIALFAMPDADQLGNGQKPYYYHFLGSKGEYEFLGKGRGDDIIIDVDPLSTIIYGRIIHPNGMPQRAERASGAALHDLYQALHEHGRQQPVRRIGETALSFRRAS